LPFWSLRESSPISSTFRSAPADFGALLSNASEVLSPLVSCVSIVDAIPVPVSTSSDTTPTATRPATTAGRRRRDRPRRDTGEVRTVRTSGSTG
jgi:hypothetical protein